MKPDWSKIPGTLRLLCWDTPSHLIARRGNNFIFQDWIHLISHQNLASRSILATSGLKLQSFSENSVFVRFCLLCCFKFFGEFINYYILISRNENWIAYCASALTLVYFNFHITVYKSYLIRLTNMHLRKVWRKEEITRWSYYQFQSELLSPH